MRMKVVVLFERIYRKAKQIDDPKERVNALQKLSSILADYIDQLQKKAPD